MMVKHHGPPIHHLGDLLDLIKEDAWTLATQRCRDDVQSLALDRAQVATMLLSLQETDFRRPWSERVTTDYGRFIADDYKLWFDENTKTRCAFGKGLCFYIKLAVYSDKEGDFCLVVSFHLDSRP